MNTNMYNRIEKLFKKFNLPIVLPKNVNIEELINLMAKDKKNSNKLMKNGKESNSGKSNKQLQLKKLLKNNQAVLSSEV